MSLVESRSVAELPEPSHQSLLALSWPNSFLSGTQTAFGPIAAAYLAAQRWTAKDIGFVLTIGGSASLVSQAPGGELVDAVRAKRRLVATSVVTIALSILIVDHFGRSAGFLSLAAEGLVAVAVLAVFLPETKEKPPLSVARRTAPMGETAR